MKSKYLAALMLPGIMVLAAGLLYGERISSGEVELDKGEREHLVFMRLTEKLGRDLSITLGNTYFAEQVFAHMVPSQQKYTDSVEKKLTRYQVADPIHDLKTDDPVGVFLDPLYGAYFESRFNALVERGMEDVLEAYYAGAFMEELNMQEIAHCPDFIVRTFSDIDRGECGLDHTNEKVLIKTYGTLLGGSEEHLRAYVRNIEKIIGEGGYVAQVLSQEEVAEILGR